MGFIKRKFKKMYDETKQIASGLLQLEENYPEQLKKDYDKAITSRIKFTYQTTVSFEEREAKEILNIADKFFGELSVIMIRNPNIL